MNQFPPEKAEKITGVDKELIREAARMYASNGPAGIMFSASPVVHNINGMQNYRAVMCLIALTGNYDIPGGNPSRPGPVSPCNEYGKVKRLDTIEAIGEKDFPAWFDLPCEEAQCTRIADYILSSHHTSDKRYYHLLHFLIHKIRCPWQHSGRKEQGRQSRQHLQLNSHRKHIHLR